MIEWQLNGIPTFIHILNVKVKSILAYYKNNNLFFLRHPMLCFYINYFIF